MWYYVVYWYVLDVEVWVEIFSGFWLCVGLYFIDVVECIVDVLDMLEGVG